MLHVKICGLTTLEDARFAAGAGADYLGFWMKPGAERYIHPDEVRAILEWVHGATAVGVFADQPPEEVNRLAAQAGVQAVQLDGHETPEDVAAIDLPVIKSFSVQHDASSEHLRALLAAYHGGIDHVLLDTSRTSMWGPAGESLNWRVVRELAQEARLFLRGAITAENLESAAETMQPYGVDLLESMEIEPGIKDFDRLAALFDRVREMRG
jgi:phosphoribosylanthranilate isomerase